MNLRNKIPQNYADQNNNNINITQLKQDLSQIHFIVAKELQYRQMKIFNKSVSVVVSTKFAEYLINNFEIGYRFKPNEELVQYLLIPTVNEIDKTVIMAENFLFNIRIPKVVQVNNEEYLSNPIFGIKFYLSYNINNQ